MDFGTLLAPIGTDLAATVADVVPVGIVVFGALVGIGIALGVLRKFGVRK